MILLTAQPNFPQLAPTLVIVNQTSAIVAAAQSLAVVDQIQATTAQTIAIGGRVG